MERAFKFADVPRMERLERRHAANLARIERLESGLSHLLKHISESPHASAAMLEDSPQAMEFARAALNK